MTKALIILGLLIGVAVFIWVIAPKSETTTEPSAQSQTITNAVSSAKQNQAFVLDVRSPEEYNSGHVDVASNFDVELLSAGKMPDLDKNADIYVYCRSGNRSATATQILKQNGFTNVTDIGGLDDLKKAGVL